MESSVTDWIQASCAIAGLIASAIGIFYVVRSFSAQTRINAQQLELIKIEQDKAVKEVKPVFHFEPKTPGSFNMNLHGSLGSGYRFYCSDNLAQGVCFEYLAYVPHNRYSQELKLGKTWGTLFPAEANQGVGMQFLILDSSSTDITVVRVHYIDAYQRTGYADYRLSMGYGILIGDYPPSPYPGVNKISEQLSQDQPMQFFDIKY
ncbi:hypothetical protein [Hymenobacter sp. PAMC 26628]|uniref:hypothetical protein n=1 Tax=Hymenobacter sp. PAMC 26628 TaxID=1484118 RepID=UPI000A67C772|nr:hypothetical protein [Hymenobacter sp. PAMC 26628]